MASLTRYRSVLWNQEKTLPVLHMLTALFLHKTHHRGQITTLISQCGYDYGTIDFIALPELADF